MSEHRSALARGGQAMDELTALVRDLGSGLKARVEAVEANQAVVEERQAEHRAEVENRLNRYEETNTRMADRVVTSVERLARLEAIPERMDKLERMVANQSRWMQREITALNARINGVEQEIKQGDAEHQGQLQAGRMALESVKFMLDYGWKIAMILGGGTAVLMALENDRAGPRVTIQQPAEVQGLVQGRGGQDMPLRLE